MSKLFSEIFTGHGGASSQAQPIAASRRLDRGLFIRAQTTNNASIFVGPMTVSTENGFELYMGDEVFLPIDDPSKVYVIANPVLSQQQTVAIGPPLGDKFVLTFNGETTVPLYQTADAATLQAALEALASIGVSNVTVTGINPYMVEFTGDLAGINHPLLTGVGGTNETQNVSIDGTTTGGTFTLSLGEETTEPIPYNATAADLKAALEALDGIDLVSVVGGPGPGGSWSVEFQGPLSYSEVDLLVGDGSLLTGGTSTDVTIVETIPSVVSPVTVSQTLDATRGSRYSWLAQ